MNKTVIILAAGKGTRMESDLPKVLHKVGPKSMVEHVIDASIDAGCSNINLVVGYGSEKVKLQLQDRSNIKYAQQEEQLGTGHAVKQALPLIEDNENVIILYGDVPLIKSETLAKMLESENTDGINLLTVRMDNPKGYGRIVRENDEVTKIVEEKDASDEIKKITEVNTGIMSANGKNLKAWLNKIDNKNAQNEYYLTDIIEIAKQEGAFISTVSPETEMEVMGANTKEQLAILEMEYNKE